MEAHTFAAAQRGALGLREVGQRAGQGVHPALRQPHAGLFDVGDEHQRRRREERRRAAIGGVAPEQLPQPRVGEMLGQCLVEDGEGADRGEPAGAGNPVRGHELVEPWPLAADEGCIQRLEHAGGAGDEVAVSLRFDRPGEGADRGHAAFEIGVEIEAFFLAPSVAREDVRRPQRHGGLEAGAGIGEDLVEDPAHRQHGRPGVDRGAPDRKNPHLAAGRGLLVDEGHGTALPREIECGHDPADAGADHDDRRRAHGPPFEGWMSILLDTKA